MAWLPVGLIGCSASTGEVALGRVAGDLDGAPLTLRVRTLAPGPVNPLSYGWLGFRSLPDDDRPLGRARYYASPDAESVAFPLPPTGLFDGLILFDPRRYNREWLDGVVSGGRWEIAVEAWLPGGSVDPRLVPFGFVEGGTVLTVLPFEGQAGAALGILGYV